ncbi:single hybrid motif-containing protein [Gyrodon lividus]|nr:single hybrid motif-containing protein [Gyrodon lividus]
MQAVGHRAITLRRPASFARIVFLRRCLHQTGARYAITNLEMPAMSPTMTEGGISSWKKKEGEPFSAGEVLLEIETDKATIDVEAQEDGVLGKILLRAIPALPHTLSHTTHNTQALDGTKNVPVGRVIALLAEEGDDISNLEAPKEEPKPAPSSKPETSAAPPSSPSSPSMSPQPLQESVRHSHHPTHSKHLLPSVIRLLIEGGITNAEVIKGTGVRGMLTKGDVLSYLGKASNPLGTYKLPKKEMAALAELPANPLDGAAIRYLIVSGLAAKMKPASYAPSIPATFDSIIADYLPPASSTPIPAAPSKLRDSTTAYFDGLF